MLAFVVGPFDGARCPLIEPPNVITLPICDALVRAMTGRMSLAELLNKDFVAQKADRAAEYAIETSVDGLVYRIRRDLPLLQ